MKINDTFNKAVTIYKEIAPFCEVIGSQNLAAYQELRTKSIDEFVKQLGLTSLKALNLFYIVDNHQKLIEDSDDDITDLSIPNWITDDDVRCISRRKMAQAKSLAGATLIIRHDS